MKTFVILCYGVIKAQLLTPVKNLESFMAYDITKAPSSFFDEGDVLILRCVLLGSFACFLLKEAGKVLGVEAYGDGDLRDRCTFEL